MESTIFAQCGESMLGGWCELTVPYLVFVFLKGKLAVRGEVLLEARVFVEKRDVMGCAVVVLAVRQLVLDCVCEEGV